MVQKAVESYTVELHGPEGIAKGVPLCIEILGIGSVNAQRPFVNIPEKDRSTDWCYYNKPVVAERPVWTAGGLVKATSSYNPGISPALGPRVSCSSIVQ
jgi:hypothetical protein